jgi:HAD superfamily hydrolase (TIGR01490 family)
MAQARRAIDHSGFSAAEPAPALISVFDVDRTLTRLPTYSPFLLYAARRRAPWRLLLIPALLPIALLHLLRLTTRARIKEAMHALMLGRALPERDAVRLADAFARRLADEGLYDQGVALIAAERAAGRRVVLATAAPHFYTAALARRLGIGDVVATGSSWQGGRLLAKIRGRNCYGAAKREMLEAFLSRAGVDRGRAHIRFYSDHASDLPTFEYSDEPIAVNPSKRLQAIARDRGWPILDWRGAAHAG